MAILYRTAKFKSANTFAMAIWDPTAKFNFRQYFRLYSTAYITTRVSTRYQTRLTTPYYILHNLEHCLSVH